MRPHEEPAEEDLVLMLDYLDGRLEKEEMRQFEARLADDPGLESALRTFLRVDNLQRVVEARARIIQAPLFAGAAPLEVHERQAEREAEASQ